MAGWGVVDTMGNILIEKTEVVVQLCWLCEDVSGQCLTQQQTPVAIVDAQYSVLFTIFIHRYWSLYVL